MNYKEEEKRIILLVGPTCVGKSDIAIELARELKTDIISADSRQVYRGMDIGTAKPPKNMLAVVRHYLIDIIDPDEPFSAGAYKRLADESINGMFKKGRIPIIAGGTGLYIKSVTSGLWSGPEADWHLRNKLKNEEEEHGDGYLHNRLSSIDPESAEKIHPHDIIKIIRALEVYYIKGKPLSYFHKEHRFEGSLYNFVMIGLRRERGDLYKRIEKRVDRMIDDGLIEEVRGLMDNGYDESLPSMHGLGYKQIIGYLKGRWDIDEAITMLKIDSKRYAKRQFTWFNKRKEVIWIDLTDKEGIEEGFQKTMIEIIGSNKQERSKKW